jgi:hypothetical protein
MMATILTKSIRFYSNISKGRIVHEMQVFQRAKINLRWLRRTLLHGPSQSRASIELHPANFFKNY